MTFEQEMQHEFGQLSTGWLTFMPDSHSIISFLTVYARWIVGGVLFVAGTLKARDINEFAITIELFRLTPKSFSTHIARVVTGLEILAGACLLCGVFVIPMTAVAFTLFTVFILAILINLTRRHIIPCNCFGPDYDEVIGTKSAIRNVVLASLCAWVMIFYDGYFTLESLYSNPSRTGDYAIQEFLLLSATILASIIGFIAARAIMKNFEYMKRH